MRLGEWLLARRSGAYLFDIALLFLILAPAGLLVRVALDWPAPSTGPGVWFASWLNFSAPSWAYFAMSDRSSSGKTVGKRVLGLRTVPLDGGRLGSGRALGRTAVKLLPWEAAHFSAFALSTDLSQFSMAQAVGLAVSNGLAVTYWLTAAWTRGRRSVHDFAAGTEVMRSGA